MKKFLPFLIIFLCVCAIESHAKNEVEIMEVTPIKVENDASQKINIVLRNRLDWTITAAHVSYVITDIDNYDAKFTDSKWISIGNSEKYIKSYKTGAIQIAEHYMERNHEYAIRVRLDTVTGGGHKHTAGGIFVQHVNGKSCDMSVLTVDSPSPIDSNTADGMYVTVKNVGLHPCRTAYLRWIAQNEIQPAVLRSFDTTNKQIYDKYAEWNQAFFYFDKPIRSGEFRQVKVTKDKHTGRVLLVANHLANGQADNAANDTVRGYFGDKLLGHYSVSNNKDLAAQFKSVKEAISYIYSIGFHSYNPGGDTVLGFPGGMSFFVKPGEYEGSLEFSHEIPNSSNANPLSIAAYSSDSTETVIIGDSAKGYALWLNNMHHFSISGFNYVPLTAEHVVLFGGHCHHFILSKSIMNGAFNAGKGYEQSVIYVEGKVDSCNISQSTIRYGSYGVHFRGNPHNPDSIAGVSHCTFYGQQNAAITVSHNLMAFVTHNTIYDNRIEIQDSHSPAVLGNRIYNTEERPELTGYAYPDGPPFSGVAIHDCLGTISFVENNICIKAGVDYGTHWKNCHNNTILSSVLNNSSVQSPTRGVWLDDCGNITFNDMSIDMTTGKSENTAALYITGNTDSLVLARSAFNSSGGGYAVYMGAKPDSLFTVRCNYYSSGGAFAMIEGQAEFNDLHKWREYFKQNQYNRSTNKDPEFYGDCDLIVCADDMNVGYQKCHTVAVPVHKNPNSGGTGFDRSVFFEWEDSDSGAEYWLQVAADEDLFGAASKRDLPMADAEMIIDEQGIKGAGMWAHALSPATTYYWRVRVYGKDMRSDWSAVKSFTTDNFTGIREDFYANNKNQELYIYPNPAENYIEISGLADPSQSIDIYTLAGVNIMSAEGPRVDVSHLAPGFYFVRMGGRALKFVKI